jgi:formylglycine-generating enzyme
MGTACSLLDPLDGLTPSGLDASEDAGGDGGDEQADSAPKEAATDGPQDQDAHGGPCPSGRGPTMVVISASDGGAGFCIDSTEVTNEDYADFLENASTPELVPAGGPCALGHALSDLVPSANWPRPSDQMRHPVVNVGWCKARIYCRWANKALCGGRDGEVISREEKHTTKGQWYSACSRDGLRRYPYGLAYAAGTCNIAGTAPAPVGSFEQCEGGFIGLFDMVGNVTEWENSWTSSDAGTRYYAVRGGAWADDIGWACSTDHGADQGTAEWPGNERVGFRCCAPLDESR